MGKFPELASGGFRQASGRDSLAVDRDVAELTKRTVEAAKPG